MATIMAMVVTANMAAMVNGYGNYGNYGNYAASHYGNKDDDSIKKR